MADIQHNARKHALLSSSGASRWLNCTPSARMEEHLPEEKSVYAEEGTLAHELSELELRFYFNLISDIEYKEGIKQIENHKLYSIEMPDEVGKYVSFITERYETYLQEGKNPTVLIEEKINLTEFIEDGFGTNDFIFLLDGAIEVIDLKYGRGVNVSADENPQLKLYALGAIHKHRLSWNIEKAILTIIQPRTNNYSSYEIDVDKLDDWAENVVKVKAKMAYKGEGEFNPGEWCKWCKFKPQCRAVYDDNIALMKEEFKPVATLTDDEILSVYNKAEQITSWLNSVQALVMSRLLSEKPVKGLKLVEGRSSRKLINKEDIIEVLKENNFDEEHFMSKPELLGLTHLERTLGKKKFEELLGDYVTKDKGKPTIARVDDNRGNYFSSASSDFSKLI